MRIFQTGTGPGRVVGTAAIRFYAAQTGTIDGCDVDWDGESDLVPFLPALALDEDFPNVRSIQVSGQTLWGQDAQRYLWEQFEKRTSKAAHQLEQNGALPVYGTIPVLEAARGEPVARAEFAVRANEKKQRLWGETSYSDKEAREVLSGVITEVLWDWMATQDPKRENGAILLEALQRQFAYYRENGIPSDFRMREIERAPFAAWEVVTGSGAG